MLGQLATTSILYRYMAGGVMMITVVAMAYRFIGPWAAGVVLVGAILVSLISFLFSKGIKLRRTKKASAFNRGLQSDASQPTKGKAEARSAMGELANRWNTAVKELKASGMDLYDLPWYLLIGEPQSGKSTTLKQSGLEFPVGTEALSGAGGTRNCDWWFTNEAVILDTAGRFTFQEKNAPDADEWNGFLKLLRKHRAACPINGVIVTIPCTSLLEDSAEEREQKAQNLREKLTQIQRTLEVQFPVFILITKCDMILGFTEFFSRLSATEQRQLMGWSMHGPFIQSYEPEQFESNFAKLYERIHKWRLKFIGEDLSLTDIDKLFVFPEEFRAMHDPLHDYLKTVFVKTQFLPPLFFRGFYFTSGVQMGRPVAKACAAMMRSAGAGAEDVIEHLQNIFQKSRAFFIRDFYLEKLFPERSLVIHSEKKLKVGKRMARVAIAASALIMALTVAFVVWQGVRLSRGVGTIGPLADKVHAAYMDERERIVSGDPEPMETDAAADAVKLAHQFMRASDGTIEKIPALEKPLREMHWLYFIQSGLLDQGRRLYDSLEQAQAGKSLKSSDAPEVQENYALYARMWSVNSAWLEHTNGEEGAFPKADQIRWPQMLQEDLTEETQNRWDENLQRLVEVELAQEDLDFEEKPVLLPMIPGDPDPERNPLISREVAYVASQLDPPEAERVASIVNHADNLRQAYETALPGVMNHLCGYADPSIDPYAGPRASAAQIREQIENVRQMISADGGQIGISAADESYQADIRNKFTELNWARATVEGDARKDLQRYIFGEIESISERWQDWMQRNQQRFQQASDVFVYEGGAIKLSEGLRLIEDGMGRIEALAAAQNALIEEIRSQPISSSDAIDQVVNDTWKTNTAARQAALEWAMNAQTRTDLPPRWQIPQLGTTVETMVNQGDEAIYAEAWLSYIDATAPGVLLSQGQVAEASLSPDPPRGARAQAVADANARLNDLRQQLADVREGVTCDTTRDRLRQKLASMEAASEENRQRFLGYWDKALDNWNPEAWIANIMTWESFKDDALMKEGALALRVKRDLQTFVDNVQAYRDTFTTIGDLESRLAEIKKLIEPGSGFGEGANLFTDTVGEMSRDRLMAMSQLDQPGANNRPRRSNIREVVKAASTLSHKFDAYPEKVERLVEATEQFEQVLAGILRQWMPRFEGKFPFALDRAAISRNEGEEGIIVLNIPQVEAGQLRTFFYGEDSLPSLIQRYPTLYEQWAQRPENAQRAQFIQNTLAMCDFFFNSEGAYRAIQIEGIYSGFEGYSQDDLTRISEDLQLQLPEGPEQWSTTRWRTQIFGGTATYTWAPGDYGKDDDFVFISQLGRGDNPNRAELRVPGDFSVLAYLVATSPQPEAGRRKWPVKMEVRPKGINRDSTYKINFTFVLQQQGLPPLPDWQTVKAWLAG